MTKPPIKTLFTSGKKVARCFISSSTRSVISAERETLRKMPLSLRSDPATPYPSIQKPLYQGTVVSSPSRRASGLLPVTFSESRYSPSGNLNIDNAGWQRTSDRYEKRRPAQITTISRAQIPKPLLKDMCQRGEHNRPTVRRARSNCGSFK